MLPLKTKRKYFGFDSGQFSKKPKSLRPFTADNAVRRIIITGAVQSGKSILAASLIKRLKNRNIQTAGILAKGLWKNNEREGFDLIDLKTDQTIPLARRSIQPDIQNRNKTPFIFLEAGIAAGQKALSVSSCKDAEVIVVDEVGKLEIQGMGWASCLKALLTLTRPVHIWIVRTNLVEKICQIWRVGKTEIVYVKDDEALTKLCKAVDKGL